jgi:hypothetical protein
MFPVLHRELSPLIPDALLRIDFNVARGAAGAGREAAKKRGVRFGRPRKLTLDQGELARRLVSEGKAVREIASLLRPIQQRSID